MSHKMHCKQRIEETFKKTQLNKAVTWITVFKNSFFLAKPLFFQSTLLSSVTGKSLCTPNFLAFKSLSLRENLRIKKKIDK